MRPASDLPAGIHTNINIPDSKQLGCSQTNTSAKPNRDGNVRNL